MASSVQLFSLPLCPIQVQCFPGHSTQTCKTESLPRYLLKTQTFSIFIHVCVKEMIINICFEYTFITVEPKALFSKTIIGILIIVWWPNVSPSYNSVRRTTLYCMLRLKSSWLSTRMNSTIWFWYTMLTAIFPASSSGHISVGPNTIPIPWVDIRFFLEKARTLRTPEK